MCYGLICGTSPLFSMNQFPLISQILLPPPPPPPLLFAVEHVYLRHTTPRLPLLLLLIVDGFIDAHTPLVPPIVCVSSGARCVVIWGFMRCTSLQAWVVLHELGPDVNPNINFLFHDINNMLVEAPRPCVRKRLGVRVTGGVSRAQCGSGLKQCNVEYSHGGLQWTTEGRLIYSLTYFSPTNFLTATCKHMQGGQTCNKECVCTNTHWWITWEPQLNGSFVRLRLQWSPYTLNSYFTFNTLSFQILRFWPCSCLYGAGNLRELTEKKVDKGHRSNSNPGPGAGEDTASERGAPQDRNSWAWSEEQSFYFKEVYFKKTDFSLLVIRSTCINLDIYV